MAKQANRMMIGGFVVIGVALLAASIVVFGSGRFFKHTDKYVLHFDGSIKGLNVGAPVLLQGVQIGSVSSIVLRTDREKLTMDIPVVIDIDPAKFQVVDKMKERRDPEETLQILIDKGLRAVLSIQSLITGQLLIELDFYPDTPVVLKEADSEYLEIPTIPSTTERLFQTLQKIDIEGMADHLNKTLSGIDRFVNNPDIADGIRALKVTAEKMQGVIGNVDAKMDSIARNIETTLGDTRVLINNVDNRVEPLVDNLLRMIEDFNGLTSNANASLKELVKELDKSLSGFRGVLSEDAPLMIRLEDTLQNISAMASAMRQLADYLEQHPEALIQGKEEYGGK